MIQFLLYRQNETLSWNTSDPDFTLCFERTTLIWGPSLFLWLFSSLEVYYLLNSKTRNVPWSVYNVTKLAITAALCLLNVSDLIREIILAKGYHFYSVCYITPLIQFSTFVSFSLLVLYITRQEIVYVLMVLLTFLFSY